MTNHYRALTDAGKARFEDGEFDADFSVSEEQDWLNGGVLELVPRPYKVLVDNYTIKGWAVPVDSTLTASFPIEIEAALLNGGVLERVDDSKESEDDAEEEPDAEPDEEVADDEDVVDDESPQPPEDPEE